MATKKRNSPLLKDSGIDWNSPVGEPILTAPAQPAAEDAPPDGAMRRYVGDTALSVGRGAVQGVRMLTDIAGADNAVSGGLRSVEDFIGGLQSATAKRDQAEIARLLAEAEGKGVLDQVVAGLKAFGTAPLQTMAQAAGTSLPTIAAALIPGAGPVAMATRFAAPLALGAAQGAGAVKSSIYDEVKQRALKEGRTPAEAEQLAAQAQSYGGDNAGQIALGAGLGAWAGKSGLEGAAQRLIHGGGGQAASGMASRVAMGALAEGIPEAAQGGQEKFASNSALNNAGFPTDPMSGVIANATMEGLAGHAMGGAMGIPRPGDAIRETMLPEGGPMTRAANAATKAQARAADAGMAPLKFTPTELPAGESGELKLSDKPDDTALDFEADPRFAGAKTFDNGAAPNQPMFASKTLADIHIGEQGAMGELEAVEAAPGQWTVKQTDEAANRLARSNIEQWMAKAQPMPEERARSMVKDADSQLGKKMTALPMPDGSGWTVVPTQWVSAPILMDYVEHAAAAEQANAEREARAKEAGESAVVRAPRTPSANAVEIDPKAPNAVAQFIAAQAATNTMSARAFVQDYRAGRITDADVLERINPKKASEPSADERIAAAAAQAPKLAPTDGLILNPNGEPFKTELAANRAQKKAGTGAVLQVAGGWVVRPGATTVEPSNAQDQATRVPPAAAPAPVQEGADSAGPGTPAAPAAGAAGPTGATAPAVEGAGLKNSRLAQLEAKGRSAGLSIDEHDELLALRGQEPAVPAGQAAPTQKKPPFVSKEDGEHLFGIPQKRAKALERIAKGSAYFGAKDKANDFITGNGLKETHEAFEAKPGRFEVRAKGSQPAAPENAIDRRNRLKAERAAPQVESVTTPAPAPVAAQDDTADDGATTGPDTPATPGKDDTQGQEAQDERSVQGEGPQALDGVATGEGGGPEGGGRTGRGAAGGGKRGARAGGRTDGAGVSTPRGGGSRATGVHPAEAGTQGAGDTGATGRTRRKGKGAPQVDAVDDLFAGPAEPAVPPAPQIPASNFRITPDLKLGEGGEAEKFRDNLAAIRALKAIEGDNRRATAAEQRILARYVGWGGIPNAFPHPQTKQFKPEWKARGEELQGLLSPPEHRRASSSTTDAHYTSETVTSAVWDAVKRLGFKGGLSLEMSLGSGNFIGLMPDDVAGRTRFIGVELDSITARIARALYPQSTVLESGMQYVPLATNAFDLDIGNPPFGSTSLTWQYSPSVRGLSIHNQFFVAGLNALKPGGIQAKVVSRYLMDAEDSTTREMLAVKGKLLGAIRLPETAFKTNARTEVVTDIIFIQRREKFEEEDVQQALWWLKAPLSRADYNKLDAPGKERYERLTNKYRDELQWVATSKVRDPLGGEPMVVGRYFAQNPGMVVGTMDRSGSMQHGADVTVKLAPGADFAAELAQRIQKLPEGVMDRSKEAIDAAIERHKTMADALEIAVSGQEPGQMVVGSDGKLMQVFERETPEGGYELGKREITATSPWSSQLFMDSEGRWYREVVTLGTDGKPIKQTKKDGSGPSNLNVKEREVFGADDKVPDTLRLGETRLDRLRDIAGLRDLLKRQLVLEAQDDSKAKMEANRTALAAAYDAYVAKHGYVSDTLTGALVNDMPDGALVQALELSFKPAVSKEKAAKTGDQPRAAMVKRAPIMSRRVVVPYAPPGKAESATDAMQISLAERGIIDVERIADLRGLTVDEAAAELTEGERPLAFRDPETGNLETRDAYLTGEVARKLRAARDAGLVRNAEALEAVQPEPITSDNVTVILGTSWVPSEVYAAFVTHITGEPAQVRFEPLTNTRMVTGKNTVKAQAWAARNAEGRVTVEATALLQDALNSQATKVSYKDSEGVPHLHKGDTELAEVKRKEIEREFAEWVFADGDRRRLLVEKFNEKFNTRVTRQHDGSHLMLPGKVPDEVISLRRHQKNAVWRGISERFMLLDHVVGAGKTYTAIARVMERRRMGLSRKPMIVVPNHMVEQFAADVYRLYPGAKVLAAGKKDFDKRARRRLFGKIATGDWDVVVVPHSSFQFIGLSPETEDAFLQEEMRQALKALKDAEADQESPRFKSIGVKKAEALVKKIEARLDAIKGANKDRLLTFEQMGVDDITVDEAHEFKNLFYSSRMENVRGMGDSSGSGKAFDLYTKVRYLRSTPTGSVVFMTGTPISNSAVEMFTMMRYLAADELRDLGLEHFDAWRTQFVDAGTAYEQQLTGGVKEVARLGRFWGNARSLMDLYYSFTDAVTIEDIKNAFAEDNPGKVFPVPRVKGGERQQVLVKPSPALVAKLTEIFDRYDALPDIEDVQERNAERLRLMDMARKASLDLRAVDKDTDSKEVGGKLDRVADEVARMHKLWTPDRGTQLVFLDRSVPKSKTDAAELKAYDKAIAARDKALADGKEDAYRGAVEELEKFDSNAMAEMRAAQAGAWNAYQQIKDNLIARGVPANEIRFIQEANNDEQKQAMFDAVNAGEIRVLIGSTPRMGAGTNVQERLVGLHHVDVGWKPSDIEQREGRIVRQGNELLAKYGDTFEVEVLAYATERTADASLWALNGMKLKTINGIRKYDGSFTMEFEDEDSLSMAQMAALASGDPLLLERIELVGEIDKLERLENSHRRKLIGLRDRIEEAQRAIERAPGNIEANEKRAATVQAWEDRLRAAKDARSAEVEGKTYKGDSSHYDAARAALDAAKAQQGEDEKAKFAITINGKRITSKTGIENALMESFGDSNPFDATIFGEKQVTRAGAVRGIVEKARELAINLDAGQSEGFDIGDAMGLKLVGDVSRAGWGKSYSITFSLLDADGKTLSSVESRDGAATHDYSTQFVRATFDRLFTGSMGEAYSSSANYYRDDMKRRQAELPELQRQLDTSGEFKQAGELEEKRDRLAEVTRLLTAGGKDLQHIDDFGSLFKAFPQTIGQDDFGSQIDLDGGPAYSRAQGQQQEPASDRRQAVEALVKQIASRWGNAPVVVVVDSMEDERVPKAVRDYEKAQQSKGASGAPEGFFFGGKVYLVAGQLGGDADVVRVLFHEFGHAGLRTLFGPQLSTILTRLAVLNASKVRSKAAQYGLDYDKPADRRAAAEEVLAEMAERNPTNGWVKQAVAAIRSFLRAHVPGFSKMRLSDAELVRTFVRPALDYVAGNPAMPVKTNRAQFLVDKGGADAKPFADGGIAEVLVEQGAQALNIDQRLEVMARVFGALQDLKVFEAVVGLDSVDVVNDIIDAKLTASGGRDNHAMLLERLAVKLNGPIADQVKVIDALFPAVQRAAKKLAPAEAGADGFFGVISAATTGAYKQLAADAAGKLNGRHVVTPTSDGLLGDGVASTASSPPSVSADAVEKDSAAFSRSIGDAVRDFADKFNKGPAIVGQTGRQYTPAQLAAMTNVGFQTEPQTIQERAKSLWAGAGKSLAQGLVDQFAPVKAISEKAYGLLRLSKGASGAFEALLQGGKLKISDGVYDFDATQRGGVVDTLFKPLNGEHHDFLRWVAANRADRLMGVGKENLFSPEDIVSLKSLADGSTDFDYTIQHGAKAGQVTRSRSVIYADSLKTFNAFSANVLDMAEQSGLIDGEARGLWENEFYVPFYRVEEDGNIAGANIKNGAVRQQAFRSLTGRKNKLNADLLDNTLMNWAHLLDAGAKNRAAKASIEAAEKMGAAELVDGPSGKGTVWFRENGEKRYSFVSDPHLLTAISALEYAGMRNPVMNAMGAFKRALTIGVTASPFFKIRNLIRDSVQAIGTGNLSYNIAANVAQGWKLTDPAGDSHFRLLAGGGTIHFGTMMEGNEAKRVQALVESGVDAAHILDSDHKVKAFYRKFIEPGITAYNELGNRGEEINRASLYDQLMKQGMSHAEASLQARDLMDFSMQGSFTSIRFLTQVVPFLNARIQGLYKLGRAAKEDPARFSAVLGAVTLMSLALLAAYSDDDDWKKREDWDRNNFWWFKIAGTAVRIPKPFEIGAIATLAERGFELAFDKEMTGARFRKQVLTLLGDNLSMNPIPQLVKPILDVYANKNSFTGRPIETMGMEKLKPEYRVTEGTTAAAKGISAAANAAAGLIGAEAYSPVQVDSLLRGYFGWLGSFVVGAGDVIVRMVSDQPAKATPDYWKAATGGIVSGLQDAPSRYVSQMYEQASEVEKAYGTWQMLRKQGRTDEAAEFQAENKDDINRHRELSRVKQTETRLNARIRSIQMSDRPADEKRDLIRSIQSQKDQIARALAPAG